MRSPRACASRMDELDQRSQHRHHGPHRCRQDHGDRAHPVLHGPHPQDRRGARGRRHHGLDGPGAGARHHDHLRRDDRVLARPSHQHHRYARATWTSRSRWSARCACSTARSRCSTPSPACSRSPRPSGARPTSTACRASRSSTRWTASAPTSTTPCRRWSTASAPSPVPMQMPIGAEDHFEGVVDLIEMKAHPLRRRARHDVGGGRASRPSCSSQAERLPPRPDRGRRRPRRGAS